jgi:hypothetical protein
MPAALRQFRILEIIIPGFFALIGVVAIASPKHPIGVPIGLWVFAAFAVLMFELRFARDFDAAVPVRDRGADDFIEEIASNPRYARLLASRSTRMCLPGTWRGRDIEIGTAVVAARDLDMLVSYVAVLDPSMKAPFRAMTKGATTTFARLGTKKHPVLTGDPFFDAGWVVDAAEEVAHAVLDAPVRATLLAMQKELAMFEVASIEVTRFGLVLRWPGELSPSAAARLRDLALEIYARVSR